ncbi:ABC transporter substrate-binding protein [Streptomyces radicis]|uniref:ABC transporter substrate-binding protein n=1 Tax=Streptomyces radicis TaxID=1750517 RepID=A0A3A9VRS4_9ACTN|nr:ABC transporter substrate-binding protein [Streptomyces radicis]RKN03469.1 ABC transporter substrate-binding protein [Streptomyces radicis]RKN13331.1 ABC transporter substrate-binding protein [Streptomyces radicis]
MTPIRSTRSAVSLLRPSSGSRGHRWTWAFAGALAMAMASACSAGSAGEPGDPLRLSLTHQVVYDVAVPDAVATAENFYEDAGANVSPDRVYPSNSGDAVQALISGSTDLAIGVSLSAVYSAIEQGADITIVSAEFKGYGDITYYVPADSPAQSLDDVGGQSVSTSGPGSTTDLVGRELQRQLEDGGARPPELAALGNPPDVFTAVRTGQVDVGWTTPPFFFDEIQQGTVRQIGTGNDVGELAGITSRVNITRSEVAEQRMPDLQAFFRAYEQALDFTEANPDRTIEIWTEASQLDATPEVLEQARAAYPRESLDPRRIEGLDVSLRIAHELEFISQPLSEDEFREHVAIDEIFDTDTGQG